MITASSNLQNIFKQNYSIKTSAGCLIEYNWNQMTDIQESNVTSSGYWQNSKNIYPFKKLFPADSVIKPFRPNKAGIKYAIDGDLPSSIPTFSSVTYPNNYRLYLPGIDTVYKYWISKKDEDNQYLTITYPKDIVTNKIVVKFEISHSIPAGWEINVTGSGVTDISQATKIKDGVASDIQSFSSEMSFTQRGDNSITPT